MTDHMRSTERAAQRFKLWTACDGPDTPVGDEAAGAGSGTFDLSGANGLRGDAVRVEISLVTEALLDNEASRLYLGEILGDYFSASVHELQRAEVT